MTVLLSISLFARSQIFQLELENGIFMSVKDDTDLAESDL